MHLYHPKQVLPATLCLILGLSACKEKPAQTGSNAPADDTASATSETSPVVSQKSEIDLLNDRAALAGFARHLPASTECVVSLQNSKIIYDYLKKAGLADLIEKGADMEGLDMDAAEKSPEAKMAIDLLSTEVLIAFGESTGQQGKNVISAMEESAYTTTRRFMNEIAAKLDAKEEAEESAPEILRVEKLLALLSQSSMPPITISLKGGESSQPFIQKIQEAYDFALNEGSPVEAIEKEVMGNKFKGIKVVGAKVAEFAASMGSEIPNMTEAQREQMMKSISEKNLVFLSGVIDGHAVMFLGAAEEQLQLVEKVTDSVLSSSGMGKLSDFAGKKPQALVFATKALQEKIAENASSLRAYAEAMNDSFAAIPALGDTRDLSRLIGQVLSSERVIYGSFAYDDSLIFSYFEDGLKLESYGGARNLLDKTDGKRELAAIGEGESVFLFANVVQNPKVIDQQFALIDSLGALAWAMSDKISSLDLGEEVADAAGFKQGFTVAKQIQPELLSMWKAIRHDYQAGVTGETALVIDLAGEMPQGIPNLPKVLAEKGKLPRLSFVNRVADRSKIQAAWAGLDQAATGILTKLGNGITKPAVMDSEKDGLKTYFYSLPFQTNDLVLNVSVSDDLLFASTSKLMVQELNQKFKTGQVSDQRKGNVVEINFAPLSAYADEWLKLLIENAKEVFPHEEQAEEFLGNREAIEQALKHVKNFKKLSIHQRLEENKSRTSLHLEMQKL